MTSPTGDIVVPVSTMNGMVQSPLINAEASGMNTAIYEKVSGMITAIYEKISGMITAINEKVSEENTANYETVSEMIAGIIFYEKAPEMVIVTAAVSLAASEKAASWFGKVAFIWATVVLLGGFVASLETLHFWFVCTLLVVEGFRIFWERGGLIRVMRTWAHSMQLLAAEALLVLSSYGLHRGFDDRGNDNVNRNRALTIFYCLCAIDASLALLTYSYLKISLAGFSKVKVEYSLSESQFASVCRCFFDDTYSRCIGGSLEEGLRMDFVSYSMELLQSCGGDEQLTGVELLLALAKNDRFPVETLGRIGSRQDVVERLFDMLNWENLGEQNIRRVAAQIILILVNQNRNRIRGMSIAGFMESIASLLYDINQIEIHARLYGNIPNKDYAYSDFSLLGLRILESFANDHDNCTKIGSSRGLLPKIFGLTELNPNDHDNCTEIESSRGPLPSALESQIDTAKLAFQLMGTLALQKKTWEIFFAIQNLRGVLWNRETPRHEVQIRAIDTLTSLAQEQEGCEIIGGTGGVLRNLFSLFFMEINNDEAKEVVIKAGKALSLLSVENKHNCEIMISIKLACHNHRNLIARLISVLHEPVQPVQGIYVLRILRNLWAYRETVHYDELREITATAKQVVMFVTEKQGEHQEAAIGLAAQMFKFMTKSDFDLVFETSSGVPLKSLISKLVELPSIRRFSIELLIAVMDKDRNSAIEMRSKLEEAFEGQMETTTEMETKDGIPVESLRQFAMELLRRL